MSFTSGSQEFVKRVDKRPHCAALPTKNTRSRLSSYLQTGSVGSSVIRGNPNLTNLLFSAMFLAEEVEAKNLVLIYGAPGVEEASGATGYLPRKGGNHTFGSYGGCRIGDSTYAFGPFS